MKKSVLILFMLFAIMGYGGTEKKYFRVMGEVYFRFQQPQHISINEISRIVSISKISPFGIYAYANEKEFTKFLSLNIPYEILEHPNFMAASDPATWFSRKINNTEYPSYSEYILMMTQFQTSHPDICALYELGTSVNGRKILCIRITGTTDVFFKPRIFLSSTIHGNEPAGYVMMLYLIDYLLSNYGVDSAVTDIINRAEVWINPLANPDGTYWAGDETVFGARRYNANNIDLNRNFPDPAEGEHPDGNPWQPETITMMDFANAVKPTLSAGFHSGSEVVNYPWDTWERLHADNDWFIDISQRYAEAARSNSPETYMTDLINGITNGYAWYRITGGKQDYMNYFQQSREVTIEISRDCLPDSPYLYWTYNKNAIMGLIAESLTGLCGRIQCSDDCTAIKAKVEIPDRDCDNSFIFSQEQTGKFCRLLLPGRYNIKISSFYHYPKLIENIDVNSGDFTRLDVSLDHTNRGDISADGIIDIQDVILCLRIAIGLEPIDLQSADINKDTMVDIIDVILILQMSIGLN